MAQSSAVCRPHDARIACALALIAAAAFLTFGACSKLQPSEERVVESGMAQEFDAESAEYVIRELIDELTIIAASNSDDPARALQEVRDFVEANQDKLEESATELERAYANLEPVERQAYALQVSDYLQGVTIRWNETLETIRSADEASAARIESLLSKVLE